MVRLLTVVAVGLLVVPAGSGGWYEPQTPPLWADARYPMSVTVHAGRLDSGTSCSGVMSVVPRGFTAVKSGMRCGPEGGRQVGVEYTFVGRALAGDRYRLIRTVPAGENNPEVTTAVVVFAGSGRQIVFEAADHVVTVEPPGFVGKVR